MNYEYIIGFDSLTDLRYGLDELEIFVQNRTNVKKNTNQTTNY